MAKTTTAKRAFKIVDLIRKRESFEFIEVPEFPVEVVIEVTTTARLTTPKPAPSAVFDRLEQVAREKLGDGLQNAEGFLDEMEEIMKGGGLDCDDSTVIQKLQKLNVSTILSEGGSLVSNIKDVYSLVSNVSQAVS